MQSYAQRLEGYLRNDPRLNHLYTRAKEAFDKKDLIAHGWDHTYRVIINAIRIGEAEGADMAIVLPSVVLHDIGFLYNPDPKVHNVVGAENCSGWLEKWGDEERTQIRSCILTHKGKYRGFAFEPETLEAKVVCDADLLEKVGYIGILQGVRTFTEFAQSTDINFKSLRGIAQTLAHIVDIPFYTKTGQKIADQRGGYLRAALCKKALSELDDYL